MARHRVSGRPIAILAGLLALVIAVTSTFIISGSASAHVKNPSTPGTVATSAAATTSAAASTTTAASATVTNSPAVSATVSATASTPTMASTPGKPMRGTSTGKTIAVPGLNNGESASFVVTDTGSSILVFGQGRGMRGAKDYVSLIYPDGKCAMPEPTAGLTLGGAWQSRGDGAEFLYERFDGAAYRAVRGNIGSVSVREITAATNAGGGNFTLTATARACAPLNAQR